jgi:hypothetical protein
VFYPTAELERFLAKNTIETGSDGARGQ